MKKIITISLIAIISGFFVSSCNSGTSIIKRHYNRGYYVSHTKKASLPQSKKETMYVKQQKKIETPLLLNNKTQVLSSEKNDALSSTNNSTAILASNFTNQSKHVEAVRFKEGPTFKALTLSKPFLNTKANLFMKKQIGNASASDDALSLFWIIILVLLIIWALGFILGGVGTSGFIHLLLLVALILFILWLLRIV